MKVFLQKMFCTIRQRNNGRGSACVRCAVSFAAAAQGGNAACVWRPTLSGGSHHPCISALYVWGFFNYPCPEVVHRSPPHGSEGSVVGVWLLPCPGLSGCPAQPGWNRVRLCAGVSRCGQGGRPVPPTGRGRGNSRPGDDGGGVWGQRGVGGLRLGFSSVMLLMRLKDQIKLNLACPQIPHVSRAVWHYEALAGRFAGWGSSGVTLGRHGRRWHAAEQAERIPSDPKFGPVFFFLFDRVSVSRGRNLKGLSSQDIKLFQADSFGAEVSWGNEKEAPWSKDGLTDMIPFPFIEL